MENKLCDSWICNTLRKIGLQLYLDTCTIADASDFLLERYDVHIQPEMYREQHSSIKWKAVIYYIEEDKIVMDMTLTNYQTRNEAVHAGIKYILKHLLLC